VFFKIKKIIGKRAAIACATIAPLAARSAPTAIASVRFLIHTIRLLFRDSFVANAFFTNRVGFSGHTERTCYDRPDNVALAPASVAARIQ
jgi:hypothetical protein